jgi:hypothetical protein
MRVHGDAELLVSLEARSGQSQLAFEDFRRRGRDFGYGALPDFLVEFGSRRG